MTIEDIILDRDRRGISKLRQYLPADFCDQAAGFILEHPGKAIITTGFYILAAGVPETDGPPGAVAIGNALEALGFEVEKIRRWIDEARSLADSMIDLFWDESQGFFYDTGRDHEKLVVRPRDIFDSAVPCGGSVAADALLRLAVITGESDYQRKAATSLRTVAPFLGNQP
ncbi:MAG: DUF4392 domain-containing protein, partial [Chloroflexi bacterium]|nr:DUF4392 domain-containing protein [Chloroflexota bacterium]